MTQALLGAGKADASRGFVLQTPSRSRVRGRSDLLPESTEEVRANLQLCFNNGACTAGVAVFRWRYPLVAWEVKAAIRPVHDPGSPVAAGYVRAIATNCRFKEGMLWRQNAFCWTLLRVCGMTSVSSLYGQVRARKNSGVTSRSAI